MSENERARALGKAYTEANRRLRNNHPTEFHEILADIYADMGLDVKKRLTGERKRQADIAALKERLASLEGAESS